GIYTGSCHFFLLEGTPSRLIPTGPAATKVAKLLSEAGPGEINVSAERLAHAFEPIPGIERFADTPSRAQLTEQHRPEYLRVATGFLKFAGVDKLIAREGLGSVHARLTALGKLVE